jgi:antitoxin Phd
MNNIWQLQDAKSKFSEVVDRTLTQGVLIVTRRGKKAVVVIPFEEYERLTARLAVSHNSCWLHPCLVRN